jgi:hypothetical protein
LPAIIYAVLIILALIALVGGFGWLILDEPDCRPYRRLAFVALVGLWAVHYVAGPLIHKGS